MYIKKDFYVVAILSDTELIINAGRIDHVQLNSSFDILDNEVAVLKDPVTGEVLDEFHRKKQRVYVKSIKPKYCVCTSIYTKQTRPSALQSILDGNKLISETIGRKMNVDKKDINNITSGYSYSKIHIKDKAKLVIE